MWWLGQNFTGQAQGTIFMSKSGVERKSAPPVGKFSYNDDLRKYHGKKYAENLKKKELETQRFKKAAALRKYAKLCKAEGIQSDRVRLGKRDDSEPREKSSKPSRPEYKPFMRAEKEAARLQQMQEEKELHRQQTMKEKEEAAKKREIKKRALSKTTKKGQPVLGNHIKSILEKLQKAQ